MTAQTITIAPATPAARGGMLLGFGTVLDKELTEWARGRAALIIGGLAIATAAFTTVIPFIAPQQPGMPILSMDPTTNVLLGWSGLTAALIALLATMSLISVERDRGTLAWSLSQPVSPTSILLAKFIAAFAMISVAAVILPLGVSVAIATVAYGALPDIATVATFGALYLAVPAFYIALTLAIGTRVRSTGGIAGIAFAVLFLPTAIGALAPIVIEVSPTSIGTWALAVATGGAASSLTLAGWIVTMAALGIGAKLVFDRQEF